MNKINIKVIREVDPPLEYLQELAKEGDWWARKILKENGEGDYLPQDEGEWREPRSEV